jgi:hypothetical protein
MNSMRRATDLIELSEGGHDFLNLLAWFHFGSSKFLSDLGMGT